MKSQNYTFQDLESLWRCKHESKWANSCHEHFVEVIDGRLFCHGDISQVHKFRKTAWKLVSRRLKFWQYDIWLKIEIKVLLFSFSTLVLVNLIRINSGPFSLLNSLEVEDSLNRIWVGASIYRWIVIGLKSMCLLFSQLNWIHSNEIIIITLVLIIANVSSRFFLGSTTGAIGSTSLASTNLAVVLLCNWTLQWLLLSSSIWLFAAKIFGDLNWVILDTRAIRSTIAQQSFLRRLSPATLIIIPLRNIADSFSCFKRYLSGDNSIHRIVNKRWVIGSALFSCFIIFIRAWWLWKFSSRIRPACSFGS